MVHSRRKARELALQMLFQWDSMKHSYSEEVFETIQVQGVSEKVEQFAKLLVKGVMDHLSEIDQWIHQYTDHWALERMAIVDRNILRFSIFELLYLGDVPAKVTLNEAIEVAKRFGSEDSGKFVNGVLDKFLKNHEHLFQKEKTQPEQGTKTSIKRLQ